MGFPERGVEDSTLWIGSSGAHTPCHLDTYGCNIIAQVYGKYVFYYYIQQNESIQYIVALKNMVLQIDKFIPLFSIRKRWLLFPPSETNNLKPTRVPYEESSIYSNINFSCFENCKGL